MSDDLVIFRGGGWCILVRHLALIAKGWQPPAMARCFSLWLRAHGWKFTTRGNWISPTGDMLEFPDALISAAKSDLINYPAPKRINLCWHQ